MEEIKHRMRSNPKRRIAMAVSNDLLTDQRVARHRQALEEAGCEVLVVGRNDLPLRHQRGWRFYAELNWQLWRRLRKEAVDVVWANDSDTLPGCYMASLRSGVKLVMDAHELMPEVPELVDKPLVRWVWRTIERLLMPRCDGLLTVCGSIASHYRNELGVQMSVVRNLPAGAPVPVRPHEEGRQRILLYQGRVNKGRGVDWAIDALEWLPDCRLVVAGDGDLLEEMQRRAASKPWSDRIRFTGRLMPHELEQMTLEADVGLVMLEDIGLSYHYALPNRVGDFVRAGVPMVVSDLPEMAAVVRRYKVGEIMREPGAEALAQSVRRILDRHWTDDDFAAARRDMNWEKEKNTLTALLDQVTRQQ